MHQQWNVICGLNPNEEDFYSWYELSLIMERSKYQEEMRWNHTRHLMAAITGQKPKNIIALSFDKPDAITITSQEDKQRILNKYKPHLAPSHEQ